MKQYVNERTIFWCSTDWMSAKTSKQIRVIDELLGPVVYSWLKSQWIQDHISNLNIKLLDLLGFFWKVNSVCYCCISMTVVASEKGRNSKDTLGCLSLTIILSKQWVSKRWGFPQKTNDTKWKHKPEGNLCPWRRFYTALTTCKNTLQDEMEV